jgi:hypothetical protein
MTYTISPADLEQIAKLPPEIAALAPKYPIQLVNVADSWNNKPLPENYIPRDIEVYCGDSEEVLIYVLEGEILDFNPVEADRKSTSLSVRIDGDFVYIEIEGKEILNKLGGVILPEISFSPEEILQNLVTERE